MPRCSCAACGPASFRDGRRQAEFECDDCDALDGKFDTSEVHRFAKCKCGAKIGLGCLDAFGESIVHIFDKKLSEGDHLDDPYELWEAIRRGAHRDAAIAAEYPLLIQIMNDVKPMLFEHCFFCEDTDVGAAPARTPASLKVEPPDLDPPVTVLAPIRRKGPDGIDLDHDELRQVKLIAGFPVVAPESCASRFKGGVGSRDEVGGALRSSLPSSTSPCPLLPALLHHPLPRRRLRLPLSRLCDLVFVLCSLSPSLRLFTQTSRSTMRRCRRWISRCCRALPTGNSTWSRRA